jgi:hypothetical protein
MCFLEGRLLICRWDACFCLEQDSPLHWYRTLGSSNSEVTGRVINDDLIPVQEHSDYRLYVENRSTGFRPKKASKK